MKYEYPQEIVPDGYTPTTWLRALTEAGAARRFPAGAPNKVKHLIEYELGLVERLKYEAYFLTVADIVGWARAHGILCQGRGLAQANSAVCYCLGVTEVDPNKAEVLFKRFISEERGEPPDIDVDFEHQRREEVIQYLYKKYGRHRAALTGVIIRYRTKSAVRDIRPCAGHRPRSHRRRHAFPASRGRHRGAQRCGGSGSRSRSRSMASIQEARLGHQWIVLSLALRNQPRHLSQHPGGFVIAKDDVALLVPVENAAMENRSIIQWDKDDLDVLGLIKVDILALGMLSALRRGLLFVDAKMRQLMPGPPPPGWFVEAKRQEQLERRQRTEVAPIGHAGNSATRIELDSNAFSSAGAAAAMGIVADRPGLESEASLQDIPEEDGAVYDMLQTGDSVGVFQVESRAQMSMLPRLKPKEFYDLVVEVAIVRPGPIQGGMVHPYLQRREQKEPVRYPSKEAEKALERTLGVPIFQEQVMQLAILAADFTPGEADQLRRAITRPGNARADWGRSRRS